MDRQRSMALKKCITEVCLPLPWPPSHMHTHNRTNISYKQKVYLLCLCYRYNSYLHTPAQTCVHTHMYVLPKTFKKLKIPGSCHLQWVLLEVKIKDGTLFILCICSTKSPQALTNHITGAQVLLQRWPKSKVSCTGAFGCAQ